MRISEQVARLVEERDALQARIDAGVRVYNGLYGWVGTQGLHTNRTGLLIDVQPIAQVEDDRKEDRRKAKDHVKAFQYGYRRNDVSLSNDRRKTPGTKADRKPVVEDHSVYVDSGLSATAGPVYYEPEFTRADGSTNPRVGERRIRDCNGASWRINQTTETVGKFRISNDRRKA